MTRIKLCGLTRECDIEAANELKVDYIGFVFAKKSRRYIEPDRAKELKAILSPEIKAVGVFVDETPEHIAELLGTGVIDIAQLHGKEDNVYIRELKHMTDAPIIKAFRIDGEADIYRAKASAADYVLLDSGTGGTGSSFDWSLVQGLDRLYFLAGGLHKYNVGEAVRLLHPYAVDVSSGIETDGLKDRDKMVEFTAIVRKENKDDE